MSQIFFNNIHSFYLHRQKSYERGKKLIEKVYNNILYIKSNYLKEQ